MAIDTAADLAVFFDTDEFAAAGTYTPAGAAAVAITAIMSGAGAAMDLGALGVASTGWTALVRASEITTGDPKKPDVLVITAGAFAGTYEIREAELDISRAVWTLRLNDPT